MRIIQCWSWDVDTEGTEESEKKKNEVFKI